MNNKEISKLIKDYTENFPNMPTRTLAKKIENEANLGLTSENIRGRLRYLKGLHPLNKKGYGNESEKRIYRSKCSFTLLLLDG